MAELFTLHHQLGNDCIELAELPLSKLLLMNDSSYPWFILVPKVAGVTEIFHLGWEQQQQLLNESSLISELIYQLFQADKINVAALGNVVPQLHVHHIVRYTTDKSWPAPVFGQHPPVPYTDEELAQLKQKLLPALADILPN